MLIFLNFATHPLGSVLANGPVYHYISWVTDVKGWGVEGMRPSEDVKGWGVEEREEPTDVKGWGVEAPALIEDVKGWGVEVPTSTSRCKRLGC